MLKRISFIVLILALPVFAQYSFEFTCLDDTIKAAGFDDFVIFYFQLQNTGSQQDIYEFDCTINQHVSGWYVLYCAGGL